jgi:hypothetical protein
MKPVREEKRSNKLPEQTPDFRAESEISKKG